MTASKNTLNKGLVQFKATCDIVEKLAALCWVLFSGIILMTILKAIDYTMGRMQKNVRKFKY